MESIEQTIVDLGTIYQQLATLIKEQDEVIQRFFLLFSILLSIYFKPSFFFSESITTLMKQKRILQQLMANY